MIEIISHSLLKKCAEGHRLDGERAKYQARELDYEMAGYLISADIERIQRDLVDAVAAGIYAPE